MTGARLSRRALRPGLLAALAAALVAAAAPSVSSSPADEPPAQTEAWRKLQPGDLGSRALPGELLVRFRQGVDRSDARSAHRAHGAHMERRIGKFGVDVVRLPEGNSVERGLAEYLADPRVAHAEVNLARFATETVPNDPRFPELWGLRNTGQAHGLGDGAGSAAGTPDADADVSDAWDTEQGDAGTVIAVLDSGTDPAHPDLAGSLWVNPGEVAGNGVDDDGNGFVDDVNGWDFAENDNTLVEANSQIIDFDHGTHTAGTAAAQMNNGAGIAGVCPGCRLMILKFFKPEDFDGDGFREQMAGNLGAELAAIDYAIEMGADIINASFGGGPFWSRLERNAFAAAGQAGILTVAAAGNANGDNDLLMSLDFDGDGIPDSESPDFPSAYNLSTILAVAATNHHDEYGYLTGCAGILGTRSAPCAFTNWGHESVDVAAPGVDVLSTVPGGYAFFSGTSMSAPLVSGIAGLISSLHPNDSPLALKNRIMNSVDHPANLGTLHAFPGPPAQGAFTKTNGRVNAAQALNASAAGGAPANDGNIAGAKGLKTVRAGTRWTSAGKVTWPEDVNDVYRQSLKAGTYRVTLDGPAGDDFDLYVWDRGTVEIWQLQDGCFGGPGRCPILGAGVGLDADEQVRVRLRRNGIRFFHVAAFPPSEGRYKLTVLKLR